MTAALRASITELTRRAESAGVPAAPWVEVKDTVLKLRMGAAYLAASYTALGVDGVLAAAEDEWPAEVMQALSHLGFEKWDPTTLRRSLTWIGANAQRGLVSSIEGAVFELQVEQLSNSGQLPLPHGADEMELAEVLNQPGWDAVLLADGDPVGYVQMKAGATAARRIKEHLERFPEIPDVITTSEAAAASEGTLGVIDSGLLDADLSAIVEGAVDSLDFASAMDEVIPGSAAAVILFEAAMRVQRGENPADAARWARSQLTTATAAHVAGLAIEVATGVAVLRPVTAVATRLAIQRAQTGADAYERASHLRQRVAELRCLQR